MLHPKYLPCHQVFFGNRNSVSFVILHVIDTWSLADQSDF